jgi:hypothetical protein
MRCEIGFKEVTT